MWQKCEWQLWQKFVGKCGKLTVKWGKIVLHNSGKIKVVKCGKTVAVKYGKTVAVKCGKPVAGKCCKTLTHKYGFVRQNCG